MVRSVKCGLCQGCILSPLLFSLYINGAVKMLKEDKCGVEGGGWIRLSVLFVLCLGHVLVLHWTILCVLTSWCGAL